MPGLSRFAAAVAATTLLLAAPRAEAQSLRMSIGGSIGGYAAGSTLMADGAPDGFVRFGHKSGFAGGGRVTLWASARTAIEVEAMVSGAGIEYYAKLPALAAAEVTRKGQLRITSANVLWAFYKPPLEPVAMYLTLGGAMVQHQGDFFDDPELKDNTSDLGFVVGLGLRYGVARGVYLRGDARDVISTYQANDRFEARKQHDLITTVGLDLMVLQ
ncbi:MAG: outer membrane beta-barrel protein [Candidatus Eisenbacteria bacterium]